MKKPVGIEHWRKKKVRKPQPLKIPVEIDGIMQDLTFRVESCNSTKNYKKMAAWLLKAALWLEQEGR